MDKITNSWYFSKKGIGGIKSGAIKEFETWFITNFGADDAQIMLTAETVQKMWNSFKSAKENNKPFRFNLRNDKKAFFIRTETGDAEQLQIRFKGDYIENYDMSKIESAKQDYFELYLRWKDIPLNIQEGIKNETQS